MGYFSDKILLKEQNGKISRFQTELLGYQDCYNKTKRVKKALNLIKLLDICKAQNAQEIMISLMNYSGVQINVNQRYHVRQILPSRPENPFTMGDTFILGHYLNKHGNLTQPIEWIILGIEESRLLLFSKYAIDHREYHDTIYSNTSWEESTIREWLNTHFYNAAFSETEREAIIYGSYAFPESFCKCDFISLMSKADCEKLSQELREAQVTEYFASLGVPYYKSSRLAITWWLRDTVMGAFHTMHAYNVQQQPNSNRTLIMTNALVVKCAIRPIVTIDLEKYYIK